MTAKAKLTDAQIDEIRVSTLSNPELAARFGVDKSTISRARTGKAHSTTNGEGQIIPLDKIKPGNNPRTTEDLDALASLAGSIAKHGILQPVLLRPDPAKKGHYLIVAGHRRCRAAAMAKLTGVPAIVRQMDDFQAIIFALIENKEREDLDPLEEAAAFTTLQSAMTTEEIAEAYGCTARHVQSRIRLRNCLSGEAKTELVNGNITLAQAEAISAEPREHEQRRLLARCISGELKTEAAVRDVILAGLEQPAPAPAEKKPQPNSSGVYRPEDCQVLAYERPKAHCKILTVQRATDGKWLYGLDCGHTQGRFGGVNYLPRFTGEGLETEKHAIETAAREAIAMQQDQVVAIDSVTSRAQRQEARRMLKWLADLVPETVEIPDMPDRPQPAPPAEAPPPPVEEDLPERRPWPKEPHAVTAADALRNKIEGFDITVFADPAWPLWEALEVELAGVKHCGDHEFPERLCLWNPETRQYRLYEIAGGST